MLKIWKIDHFWVQNQHLWTFHKIYSLNFTEILLDERHYKVGEVTVILTKILFMPKMGEMGYFWAQNEHFNFFKSIH